MSVNVGAERWFKVGLWMDRQFADFVGRARSYFRLSAFWRPRGRILLRRFRHARSLQSDMTKSSWVSWGIGMALAVVGCGGGTTQKPDGGTAGGGQSGRGDPGGRGGWSPGFVSTLVSNGKRGGATPNVAFN